MIAVREYAPQQGLSLPATVHAPEGVKGRQPMRFVVDATDGSVRESVDSSFFGPP